MTTQTPGCGCNSDARKRQSPTPDPAAELAALRAAVERLADHVEHGAKGLGHKGLPHVGLAVVLYATQLRDLLDPTQGA